MIKKLEGFNSQDPVVEAINELVDAVNKLETMKIFGTSVEGFQKYAEFKAEPLPPKPAPPLNARVHQALGHRIKPYINFSNGWGVPPQKPEMTWQPIPRYSESRELAMRALEEYCKTINYKAVAINLVDYWQVFFFRGSIKDNLNADFTCGDTLPLAICQAIAKHHEGKDLK